MSKLPNTTLVLALFDEAPLHLCHHPKYRQHEVAHFARSRDMWIEYRHKYLPMFALVDQVKNVAGVATEPV